MAGRHPVAQHAHLTAPSPLRKIVTWLVAGLAAVALAGAGVAAYTITGLTTSIRDNSVSIGATPPAPVDLAAYPDPFSMVIIGTDECDPSLVNLIGQDRCLGEDAENHLNDVNILVHVSGEPRKVTVMSFPRDLRVERAECTDDQGNVTSGTAKLNTSYSAGGANGLKCVVDTLSALTGIPVQFAAKLSFKNVVDITDAVGGVEVCVGGDGIYDEQTGLALTPGPHTVSGGDALQFLRTRYGLAQQSDISRISNQQQYMSRLIQKLRSDDVLTNPVTLLNLASIVAKNMQTDTALADPMRMAQLALTIKDVPLEDITFVSYPVVDANDGTEDLLAIEPDATRLAQAVLDGTTLNLNGTGSGVEQVDPPVAPEGAASPAPTTPAPPTASVDIGASGQTANQQTCSAGLG